MVQKLQFLVVFVGTGWDTGLVLQPMDEHVCAVVVAGRVLLHWRSSGSIGIVIPGGGITLENPVLDFRKNIREQDCSLRRKNLVLDLPLALADPHVD